MTVNHARRRRRGGIDYQVFLLPHAFQFAPVVVEAQMDAIDERKVGADVLVGNRNPALLHVIGFGEGNVVDHPEFMEKGAADDTVEIRTGNQAVFIFRHGL